MAFPTSAVAEDAPPLPLPVEAADTGAAIEAEAGPEAEASAPDEESTAPQDASSAQPQEADAPSGALPAAPPPDAELEGSGPAGPELRDADLPAAEHPSPEHPGIELPNASCLTRTICAIKERIRWQTAAWTPAQCSNIANAILTSSMRYNLSPSLVLAVMINESDLNEKASRPTVKGNRIYAEDSGLMAVRCVLDRRHRCKNGNVRGMSWKDLMKPATNIEVGAHELAYWRDGGAVTRATIKVRGSDGRVRLVNKLVPCRHKDHAYWAHYNHGPVYIAHGYARHYPHRVAVLDHALATVLNVDTPELRGKITIRDAGRSERTVDHPLEPRYRKLCSQIESVAGCSAVAAN